MMADNLRYIHEQFERQKNMKASAYTAVIAIALFLAFFLVSWTIIPPPPPAVDEGIEVNLGNSETGLGDVPPLVPGELSSAEDTKIDAPQTTQASAETQPEVAENNEPDAPVVKTSPKPEVKKDTKTDNTSTKKTTDKPVVNAPPKVVKPKAVYKGGTNPNGTGNNADTYNKATNQGVAGGKGDQGKPNGNPNSDSYNGNGGTGNSGASITSGLVGRKIASSTRFEDTYKYGGLVKVNVTVDEAGNVTSASLNQASPFADINAIALKKAKLLKFSKGTETQNGVITFKFETPKG